MIYMFHFLTYIKDYTYHKCISGQSDLQIKHVGSPKTASVYATIFSYFRSRMVIVPW